MYVTQHISLVTSKSLLTKNNQKILFIKNIGYIDYTQKTYCKLYCENK